MKKAHNLRGRHHVEAVTASTPGPLPTTPNPKLLNKNAKYSLHYLSLVVGGFEPVPKLSIYRFLFMDLRCLKAP
ncbi:hypothetical protein NC653_035106 [Populus alba x Populus x berolinensis]|uniref:Uncharacterized protein n=1 Tax=Populus alba x Populus x berolinensis TaxID=444605 RepID=A0AAD6LP23_9ROSI|nr:hypothetical protein NC653_035106 [Populus alba x Populus x berolinensis]